MNPQDGVDYLLRALRHLRYALNRTDFFCVLVGDGDSRAELISQAAELGIADQVLFNRLHSDEDMVRYISTADICLDPNPSSPLNDVSTWIKVMEYMALGKPLVSFDLKRRGRRPVRRRSMSRQRRGEIRGGRRAIDGRSREARRDG